MATPATFAYTHTHTHTHAHAHAYANARTDTNPLSFPLSSDHLCFQESKRCNGVLLSLCKVHEEARGYRTLQRDAGQLYQWTQ